MFKLRFILIFFCAILIKGEPHLKIVRYGNNYHPQILSSVIVEKGSNFCLICLVVDNESILDDNTIWGKKSSKFDTEMIYDSRLNFTDVDTDQQGLYFCLNFKHDLVRPVNVIVQPTLSKKLGPKLYELIVRAIRRNRNSNDSRDNIFKHYLRIYEQGFSEGKSSRDAEIAISVTIFVGLSMLWLIMIIFYTLPILRPVQRNNQRNNVRGPRRPEIRPQQHGRNEFVLIRIFRAQLDRLIHFMTTRQNLQRPNADQVQEQNLQQPARDQIQEQNVQQQPTGDHIQEQNLQHEPSEDQQEQNLRQQPLGDQQEQNLQHEPVRNQIQEQNLQQHPLADQEEQNLLQQPPRNEIQEQDLRQSIEGPVQEPDTQRQFSRVRLGAENVLRSAEDQSQQQTLEERRGVRNFDDPDEIPVEIRGRHGFEEHFLQDCIGEELDKESDTDSENEDTQQSGVSQTVRSENQRNVSQQPAQEQVERQNLHNQQIQRQNLQQLREINGVRLGTFHPGLTSLTTGISRFPSYMWNNSRNHQSRILTPSWPQLDAIEYRLLPIPTECLFQHLRFHWQNLQRAQYGIRCLQHCQCDAANILLRIPYERIQQHLVLRNEFCRQQLRESWRCNTHQVPIQSRMQNQNLQQPAEDLIQEQNLQYSVESQVQEQNVQQRAVGVQIQGVNVQTGEQNLQSASVENPNQDHALQQPIEDQMQRISQQPPTDHQIQGQHLQQFVGNQNQEKKLQQQLVGSEIKEVNLQEQSAAQDQNLQYPSGHQIQISLQQVGDQIQEENVQQFSGNQNQEQNLQQSPIQEQNFQQRAEEQIQGESLYQSNNEQDLEHWLVSHLIERRNLQQNHPPKYLITPKDIELNCSSENQIDLEENQVAEQISKENPSTGAIKKKIKQENLDYPPKESDELIPPQELSNTSAFSNDQQTADDYFSTFTFSDDEKSSETSDLPTSVQLINTLASPDYETLDSAGIDPKKHNVLGPVDQNEMLCKIYSKGISTPCSNSEEKPTSLDYIRKICIFPPTTTRKPPASPEDEDATKKKKTKIEKLSEATKQMNKIPEIYVEEVLTDLPDSATARKKLLSVTTTSPDYRFQNAVNKNMENKNKEKRSPIKRSMNDNDIKEHKILSVTHNHSLIASLDNSSYLYEDEIKKEKPMRKYLKATKNRKSKSSQEIATIYEDDNLAASDVPQLLTETSPTENKLQAPPTSPVDDEGQSEMKKMGKSSDFIECSKSENDGAAASFTKKLSDFYPEGKVQSTLVPESLYYLDDYLLHHSLSNEHKDEDHKEAKSVLKSTKFFTKKTNTKEIPSKKLSNICLGKLTAYGDLSVASEPLQNLDDNRDQNMSMKISSGKPPRLAKVSSEKKHVGLHTLLSGSSVSFMLATRFSPVQEELEYPQNYEDQKKENKGKTEKEESTELDTSKEETSSDNCSDLEKGVGTTGSSCFYKATPITTASNNFQVLSDPSVSAAAGNAPVFPIHKSSETQNDLSYKSEERKNHKEEQQVNRLENETNKEIPLSEKVLNIYSEGRSKTTQLSVTSSESPVCELLDSLEDYLGPNDQIEHNEETKKHIEEISEKLLNISLEEDMAKTSTESSCLIPAGVEVVPEKSSVLPRISECSSASTLPDLEPVDYLDSNLNEYDQSNIADKKMDEGELSLSIERASESALPELKSDYLNSSATKCNQTDDDKKSEERVEVDKEESLSVCSDVSSTGSSVSSQWPKLSTSSNIETLPNLAASSVSSQLPELLTSSTTNALSNLTASSVQEPSNQGKQKKNKRKPKKNWKTRDTY